MKVLITTDLYKPQINGVVTSVLNLVDELKKLGVEVKILTLSNTRKSYAKDGVYYISSFPVKIYPDVRASIALQNHYIREIIRWKPDIIHTQCEFSTMNFAKIISMLCKSPMVHTYHTMYEYYAKYIFANKRIASAFIGIFLKNMLKSFEYIITPSYKIKKSLSRYGFNNPMVVIPSGIDLEKFNTIFPKDQKEELRKKIGIDSDDKILLNLGRIGQEKNIDKIIDYFIKIKEEKKNYSLLIVGGGPHLKDLQEKYKNIEKLYFTGMVAPEEVYKYYQLSDIFVCQSKSETQGLTYIEAMANGLPVLSCYDLCLEDILIDGENGYYTDSFEAFKTSLEKLEKNPGLYKKMSIRAKATAAKMSKQNFAKNVYSLYQEVIRNYKYIPIRKRQIKKLAKIKRSLKERIKIRNR